MLFFIKLELKQGLFSFKTRGRKKLINGGGAHLLTNSLWEFTEGPFNVNRDPFVDLARKIITVVVVVYFILSRLLFLAFQLIKAYYACHIQAWYP